MLHTHTSFTPQNDPVTSALLFSHVMNENTRAGGSDFPDTPQPEGFSALRAAEPSWASPHPSQGCPFSLFSLPLSQMGPLWAGESQPKDKKLARVPGHPVCVFSPPVWIWSPRSLRAGFSQNHRRNQLGRALLGLGLEGFYLYCFPAGIHQVLPEGPET